MNDLAAVHITIATTATGPSMGTWIFVLGFLALAPFLFTLITSFAKLVIVGGIIRQALGTPQIPPTMVITGLALILSIHIMSPVVTESYANWQVNRAAAESQLATPEGDDAPPKLSSTEFVRLLADSAAPPLRRFLERHADPRNVAMFERMQARLRAADRPAGEPPAEGDDASSSAAPIDDELASLAKDAIILVPAFLLTELTEAFQIGFLIFVPFLVIDLVASNILLAMGMHMLSPTTVSMPFKLLLFVLVDGWSLILQGVVLGYA